MKFKIILFEGFAIVEASSKEQAESWALRYYGLASYRDIASATDEDVESVEPEFFHIVPEKFCA